MKLFNFLLIILLWNTTYRCKKDELTIDCTDACNKMIGTWKGSQYSNSGGFSEQFTLKITSSDGCNFYGETSYTNSSSTFYVSGKIDEYGWIKFSETKFIENGGEYDDCLATNSSWWRCRSVRYRTGAEYEDARFKEDSFSGKWNLSGFSGGYDLKKE